MMIAKEQDISGVYIAYINDGRDLKNPPQACLPSVLVVEAPNILFLQMTASWRNFLFSLICTFIILPCVISSTAFICRTCRDDADCEADPPSPCLYGEVRDFCNRRICGQGPGDRCGGVYQMKGICGEGLFCREERCRGCSMLTLECYR